MSVPTSRRAPGRATSRAAPLPPALALLPLRLFLGVTFTYAGIQKLGDPGFLHKGAPTYIGTQLHAFANGTPGGFILRAFAIPAPQLAGVGVALVEIAVGLLVLCGLVTRAAAAVGLALNLLLFLTNSWKTSPYFLGSDVVFVFAWLPFVLAGAAGQPALDNALDALAARRERAIGRASGIARGHDRAVTRRTVVLQALGVTGGATLVLGAVAALLKGSYHPTARALGRSSSSPHPAAPHPAAPPKQQPHPAAASVPRGAVRLGASSQLPAGQAATYNDPGDQQPDIVIRQSNGRLAAFSAICTHAGCTVGYEGGQIVCPCHGGTYDASTGAVVSGPPPSGLTPRHVIESGGSIYAVPS
jgi:thiosulfate dehydrogenase (quinone) large subunit